MEDSELQRLLAQLGMEKYADSFKGKIVITYVIIY